MEDFTNFILKKEVIGTVITIFAAYAVYHLVTLIFDKILIKGKSAYEKKRKKTVVELIRTISKVLVLAIAGVIILDLFGINVSSIIASLGIASAVSALSFQDTLKDIISGTAIIMDNYFVIGDFVRYNDFTGQIIEFGLKSTKIQNADGEVLIVANRNISEITNLSQKTASALLIAPAPYEVKVEKIEKVINEIIEEIHSWETVDTDKTTYIGITELKDSCVAYGIRVFCSPGKIWEYKRKILRLIKMKFDEKKIKIPYNQIEVHNEK